MTTPSPLGPPLPDHIDPRDYAAVIILNNEGGMHMFSDANITPATLVHFLTKLAGHIDQYAADQPDVERTENK